MPVMNLDFIDGDNKKHVVILDHARHKRYRPFFANTPVLNEECTPEHAIFRFPDDPPAAVEALVQVLKHDAFTIPPNEEPQGRRDLAFLADALLIAARYHLHLMALQALKLFDQHLKDDVPPAAKPAFAADFVAAVQAAYAGDPDYTKFMHTMAFGGNRVVRRERLPELKRLIVDYAANRYEEMLEDELYGALFEEDWLPFCRDVKRAAKMKRVSAGGDDDKYDPAEYDPLDDYFEKGEAGVVNWDAFFGDERFVTIIDRTGKEWVTTRRGVYENSRFFQRAPAPEAHSTFGNAIYKLPDHPCGIEAMHHMFEEGVRTWCVPRHREKTASVAVEWLGHALLIGDKYDLVWMPECVAAAFINDDFLDRCRKPHAIANTVRALYACTIVRKEPDERFEPLKDVFAGHFAALSEGDLLKKKVWRDLFMDVPEFSADVSKERLKKKGRGEGGADKDDDGADQDVEHEET